MKERTLSIYFFNTLCSNRSLEILFNKYNVKSSNAAQMFYRLLAEGLTSNPNTNVRVNSLIPINSKEQKKIFWRFDSETENNIMYQYIPLVNLPFIRNFLASLYVFFQILFTRFSGNSINVIFVDFLRFSINVSIILAGKIRGVKVLAIVNDMPGEDVLEHSTLLKIRNKIIFFLKYDYYVCVTKQLEEVLNVNKKPSVVIESFVDIKMNRLSNEISNKFKERVVVYAGGLYELYGIKSLIEAFTRFPDEDLRLWLYGIGPFTNEILKYSKIDDRIQYRGVIPNSQLLEILIKATLLVNPRPTNEGFSKYSFPSKNLEYMSTGTPLLTTKLPGMPQDHYPYVYFIEDDRIDGVYNGMLNVLNKTRFEVHAFGLAAKDFVLQEKNNIQQAYKIVNLLTNN